VQASALPSPLREKIVSALARLLLADLDEFPDVDEHEHDAVPGVAPGGNQ
jgi:hypothetical protein